MIDVYVPGKGARNPKIVLVGEAPSHKEIEKLEPFVGPSGDLLNECLRKSGIERSEIWVTNVCKYYVTPSPKKKPIPFQVRAKNEGIDLTKQIDDLRKELQALKPNIVVALGKTALWALTGKTKIQQMRGSLMMGMGIKMLATYHPAHILHQDGDVKGYWNKQLLIFDLARALKHSHTPTLELPRRTLRVARNSAEVYDFIQRYKNHKHPAIDIEAHKCIPVCIGISFVPHEGLTIPLWNHNGISNISDNDLVNCWKLVADLLASQEVIGQNFGYDRDKIKRLGFIVKDLHSDTMLKAFTINPELPKNLAFLTSIYTEEPYYKDEGMYEGSFEDLFRGCALDACVTKEVDLAMDADIDQLNLRKFYENFILKLHDLYASIEQTGFKTSDTIRRDILKKYIEWDERLRYELYKLAGDYVNTNSPKQVSELLYNKWRLPERSGTGEDVLSDLLNNKQVNTIAKMGIENILESRRVKKTINSYCYSITDYDGRMRTSFYICLETGRSSTQQQEPPIRPIYEYRDEEGKKKTQARGMAFQTITKHGDIGSDIRTIFVPDDGEIFIQADSSQAEARVIFLLAEDYQALKDIDEHDYHALTASWFFGGTERDYSKKVLGYESPIRFAGKTLRHAGHLAASGKRAATTVNTDARKNKIDYTISVKAATIALEKFHKMQPNIRGVFHKQVIDCIMKDRMLIAPVPHGIDAPVGGTRIFFERYGDELNRQGLSYLPQRTVSENTKAAALRIRARAPWIKILVESHDALVGSVPIPRRIEAAKIFKEEFEKPIDFSRCSLAREMPLIIPCDIEEGYNYKDLHKFKWIVENQLTGELK